MGLCNSNANKDSRNLLNLNENLISNLVYYTFYWKSNQNPFDEKEKEEWTEYPEKIQKFLSTEYKIFHSGGKYEIRLIAPLDTYTVNFKTMIQKKMNDSFRKRPIKIEKKIHVVKELKNCYTYNDYRITKNPLSIIFFFEELKPINPLFVAAREKYLCEKIYLTDGLELLINLFNLSKNKIILVSSFNLILKLKEENQLDSEKIMSIFILYYKIKEDIEWTKCFRKIKGISNDAIELQKFLDTEIKELNYSEFEENVVFKAGFHFDSKEACISFMNTQIIYDLLKANLLSKDQSKKDIIEHCIEKKAEFEESQLQSLISDIEKDKFENKIAIKWYTKETYLYKMINNILRDDNISNLFRVRYIIYQLINALEKYKITKNKLPDKLYRGSKIHSKELKLFSEANIGKSKIIQIRGFTSTSKNYNSALHFSEQSFSKKRDQELSVMYRIKIDKKNENLIFDIKELAAIKSEDEILLNFDTFLKIEKIEKSTEKNIDYFVDCVITNFNQIEKDIGDSTKEIREIYKIDNKKNLDNFYLADILNRLRLDEDLINVLNRTRCENEIDTSIKLNFLGLAYFNTMKYEEALNYYFKSLEIRENQLGCFHVDTATTLNNIGAVYYNLNKNEEALLYYTKCLDIREKILGHSHPSTATSLNNIGLVYNNKGKFVEALCVFLKSLQIRENQLGHSHTSTATTLNNIGLVFYNQGNYEEALKYYIKCLKIQEDKLGNFHPLTVITYNNIGSVYNHQGKYQEALYFFSKCQKNNKENK